MRRLLCLGLAPCLLGCAATEPEPPRPPAATDGACTAPEPPRSRRTDDLLAFVPIDTPYVLAVLEPAPAGYLDRIEPVLAPLRRAVQRELDRVDGTDLHPEARALVHELDGRVSAEGLRELGIDPNPRLVLYGIGLAPVLRVRLHDGARLDTVLRRIDAADDEPWPSFVQGSVSGWKLVAGDTAVAWGIDGDDLVVTAYPRPLEREILPLAMGERMPSRSLAGAGWAGRMRRDHGLVRHGLGRIDVLAIAEAWAGVAPGLTAATARAWGLVDDDDPCGTTVLRVAARAPEILLGLTELSDDAMSGRMVWRMDDRLVAELASLAAPRPDPPEGVATVGFALDMARTEALARRTLEELHSAEPACVEADAWRDVVMPTAIAGVRSGAAVLHRRGRRDQESSYTLVLGLADPERWLGTVLPELDLDDWPRRRPVSATQVLPSTTWVDEDDFVARTGEGVALGSGARARAHARRGARSFDRNPGVLGWIDLELGKLRRAITPQQLADLDPIERALTEGLLELLGDYRAQLRVDDAGLVAEGSLELE